jgi:pimeloyl-ACP methyl ester carboxylesterase
MRQFLLYDPTEALGRIEHRTLILWGQDDEVLPVSDAQLFHDAMPNSELVIFEGLGHILMEEAPEETLTPVQAFLAEAARSHLSDDGALGE